MGAILALVILLIRRYVPETPRWLMTHGRAGEAEQIVAEIEAVVNADTGLADLPAPAGPPVLLRRRHPTGFGLVARIMFGRYLARSALGLSLMIGQAFLYNAIFFTYTLVLTTFYRVPAGAVGMSLIPFAIGNVLGPLLLGHLFDTIGRRAMIALTYAVSGVLIVATGVLFRHGGLTAATQTIAWSVVFFFASAGASAAYLTVSEIFPLELRAMAIAPERVLRLSRGRYCHGRVGAGGGMHRRARRAAAVGSGRSAALGGGRGWRDHGMAGRIESQGHRGALTGAAAASVRHAGLTRSPSVSRRRESPAPAWQTRRAAAPRTPAP
jgi:hypothetical protein